LDRRALLLLLGLALLAGAVRLAVYETAAPVGLVGDENYYVEVADRLARGEGHLYVGIAEGEARAWRPPAHPWLMSQIVDPSRPRAHRAFEDAALVRRLQQLQLGLGTLLVVLTALLGRALFDARTGWLAGLFAALYPALVVHSHYLWTENLFAVLLTAGLLGVVAQERRPGWSGALAAGLALGAAGLTREVGLVVAAAGGLWWIARAAPGAPRRAAAARSAALLAVAVAVVVPWTLRNQALFQRWIGVSTVGWFALAEGNTLEHPDWLRRSGPAQAAFHRDYFSTRNEAARLALARSHTLERLRAEQPGWLGRKLVRNLALLLNPDSVLRMKVRHGSYGDRPAAAARWLLAASPPAYLLLLSAAILGVAGAAPGGRRGLALLVLGPVLLLHVIANATPRFRVPWLPLLAIYASHACLRGRALWTDLSRGARVAAAVALLFLFGVGIPYFLVYGGRP